MEKMTLLTKLTSLTVRHSQTPSVRPHQHRHLTVSKWSPTSTRPSRRSNCTALESMGTNLQSTHSCTSPSPRLDSASRLGIQSPTILHRPSQNALHSPLPALQLAFPSLGRRSPRPSATSKNTRTATETRFDLAPCPLGSPPCFLQLCRTRRRCNAGSSLRGTCKSASRSRRARRHALSNFFPNSGISNVACCAMPSKRSDWHIQPISQISTAMYQRLVTSSGYRQMHLPHATCTVIAQYRRHVRLTQV